jgi:hypothetical protein
MHRKLVIIETPPSVLDHNQVITMMTDTELVNAKKERPDLIMSFIADNDPRAVEIFQEAHTEDQEDNVITDFENVPLSGLTVPALEEK